MSARMVQRVLRDSKVASLPDVPLADKVIEDEEEEEPAQVVRNRFDLLCLQDDGDEVEDVELHEDTAQTSPAERFLPVPSLSKGKKKKKGKKKAKVPSSQKEMQADMSAEDTLLEEYAGTANVAQGGLSGRKHTKALNGRKSAQILAVDSKFLKAEDELRRIFGSKVINSVERRGDGSGAMGNWQRRPLVRRGGKPLRKTMLTMPSEHWPRGGLSMECTEVKDGLQFFRYTYSASYMETQKQFEACVSSHDPNSIVMLLAHHPYHIDSLLAMADLHRQMGQHQQSAQYLERCLFVLESAWHAHFDPTLGTCRLDFSHNANRPLFLALFKHMQHLGRRGCHRTSLEVCKLLLSLDSDDPLGALFCIDYFALRAEQYEWLERFADEYSTDKPLSLFPSFSLSLAIARFRIEEKEQSLHDPANRPGDSAGQRSGKASSSELLKQALMLHPTMVVRIVDRAPIKEDSSWAKITKHPFFNRPSVGGPSLEHLISIYLERNYLLWRAAEVQAWLKDAASAVLQVVDAKGGGEAAGWASVREETFQTSDNEYSHLLVSDFSDTAATLPPEEVQQMGIQVGHAMGNNANAHPAGEAAEAVELPDIEGGNGILAFLQSLLPWIDPWADYFPDLQQEDPQGNLDGSSDD